LAWNHELIRFIQAKELDIFDVSSFLRSRLFTTNGYTYKQDLKQIEKVFRVADGDDF
jgi:hypothetical protein